VGLGHGHGERNAWVLTPAGARAASVDRYVASNHRDDMPSGGRTTARQACNGRLA
jgi:hypothetical protein